MRDDLGRGDRPETAAGAEIVSEREAVEEAGGVLVAGAGRVDDPARYGLRVDEVDLLTTHDQRALRATGQRRDLAVVVDTLQRGVEVVDLVQRADLGLVGEQDVDLAVDQ